MYTYFSFKIEPTTDPAKELKVVVKSMLTTAPRKTLCLSFAYANVATIINVLSPNSATIFAQQDVKSTTAFFEKF